MKNVRCYRLGDDMYIHCVCSKHIKSRKGKSATNFMREFRYMSITTELMVLLMLWMEKQGKLETEKNLKIKTIPFL